MNEQRRDFFKNSALGLATITLGAGLSLIPSAQAEEKASNTATTALMIPIAVSLANNLGADPRAVVIATVIAGSCAYATPIGMPANTMVVGLGGYKFKDYVKSGLPLILVSFAICMILLPILFPFYP